MLFHELLWKCTQSMVKVGHFQSLSHASVFKKDVWGQILLIVVHNSSVSCAVTDVEFCQGNGVANLQKDFSVLPGRHFEVMLAAVSVYLALRESQTRKNATSVTGDTSKLSSSSYIVRVGGLTLTNTEHASWKFHRCHHRTLVSTDVSSGQLLSWTYFV